MECPSADSSYYIFLSSAPYGVGLVTQPLQYHSLNIQSGMHAELISLLWNVLTLKAMSSK